MDMFTMVWIATATMEGQRRWYSCTATGKKEETTLGATVQQSYTKQLKIVKHWKRKTRGKQMEELYRTLDGTRRSDQNQIKGQVACETRCGADTIQRDALEKLGIAALVGIDLVIRADKGLLEHKTLAGVAAGHDVDGTIDRRRHGRCHIQRLLVILLVVRVNEGIHGAALLLGWGHGNAVVLLLKGWERLGIQAIEGNDSSSGGSADRAWIHSLIRGHGLVSIVAVDDRNAAPNKARDIREHRSGWGRKVSSQLGRRDIRDQEGEQLFLGGRQRRCEEDRVAGSPAVAGSRRRGRASHGGAFRVHGKGGGE